MFARSSKGKASTVEDTLVFTIQGMHCGNCGLTIDEAVEDVPGVARARTSFRSGTTEVTLASSVPTHDVLRLVAAAIEDAGYVVSPPAV